MTSRAPLTLLIALCVLLAGIEAVLLGADHEFWGSVSWRRLVYNSGAFWPGLLDDWRPNYTGQPYVMFVSYAFLHGGLSHLAGNLLALFALGRIALDRVGTSGFAQITGASALGGAVAFGLLASSLQPMVGASGAIFGLAAAWQYWELVTRRAGGRSALPVWAALAGLALLNWVLWWMMAGQLAWETHLGGALAGWAMAWALPRPKQSNSTPP